MTQSQKLLTFLTVRADLRIFVSFAFLQQIAGTYQFTKGEKNERHTIRRSPNYDLINKLQSTEKVLIPGRLRQEEYASQPCLSHIQGSYASQERNNKTKRRWDSLLGWFSKGLGRDCILLPEHPQQATRGHLYILKFQAIPQIRGTVDSLVPVGSANCSPG